MTPSLPIELLKTIFRYATDGGVDPYVALAHSETVWFAKFARDNLDKMDTKITLTRVCRRFRRIALEFLFEFVSIEKPDQAAKLVEMMKEQSSSSELRPREWIRFLFVGCSESITGLVSQMLRLSRGLIGFSWNPTYTTSRTRFQNRKALEDEMMQNIPINIRFLQWNTRLDRTNTLVAFLSKASASLQILCISRAIPLPASQGPFKPLSYPSLTHLQVEDPCPLYLNTWTIPSLTDLDLIISYVCEGSPSFFPDIGKNLRVLRLRGSFTLARPLLSHILVTYPNLEEIYYHHFTFRHSHLWESDATHMKLKKVGVTITESIDMDIDVAHSELRANFGTISKTRFPSLDTIIISDLSFISLFPKGTTLLMQRVSEDFFSAEISEV